jgi:hypothetical protein
VQRGRALLLNDSFIITRPRPVTLMLLINAHDDRVMIRHSRFLLGLAVRRIELVDEVHGDGRAPRVVCENFVDFAIVRWYWKLRLFGRRSRCALSVLLASPVASYGVLVGQHVCRWACKLVVVFELVPF